MAIGQPFLYNAPALVTTNWFSEKERTISTMLGTSSNIAGVLLGYLFPLIFVSNYSSLKKALYI
jgi:sugar phosphate permease